MRPPLLLRLRLAAALLLAGLAVIAASAAPSAKPLQPHEIRQGFRDARVIAKPRAGLDAATGTAEDTDRRLRRVKQFPRLGHVRVLEGNGTEDTSALLARLRASGRYEYVEPDYIVAAVATPNDPRFTDGTQWSLRNDGRSAGLVGADIDAATGWDLQTDASNVIVAIIDSGMRVTHEDLAANLWVNPGEIPANGRDDDNNGYIDDVHGIDATRTRSGDPVDESGHGTHVAGIIGAAANNGRGIAGVAWRVQLMPLRFLGNDSRGAISDAVECIDYAIARGAHIINASYGAVNSTTFSLAERDAIRRARAAGIIFVAAAGNDGRNLDASNQAPATLLVDNIVAVGASGRRDEVEAYSNYGSGMVEILAPGGSIHAPAHTADNAYSPLSGTSFAAPHVSGALALLKARFPGDDYRALINRLLRGSRGRTVQPAAVAFKAQTEGRLHLPGILSATDIRPLNDDFADAIRLTGANVRVRSANAYATPQGGEPSLGFTGGASLWWRWTAPADGVVSLDASESVALNNSSLGARVGVYTGSALGALTAVATPGSRFTFTARAGTEYTFLADAPGGTRGLISFSLGTEPANNAFALAAELTGRSTSVAATLLNSDAEAGEPAILGYAPNRTVWYRWTAPYSGRLQVAVYSEEFDPLVAIYTGDSLAGLTSVAASGALRPADDVTSALATLNVTAGTTYRIKVDTSSGIAGSFKLSLVDSAWQFGTGSSVTSSPAVAADGTVYFGSIDTRIYALNPDGTEKWRVTTGGIIDMTTAAVAADGTIYLGSNDRILRALNPDGTVKWTYTAEDTLVCGFALDADGNIYTKDSAGNLLAFSPAGALRWSRSVGGETFASPVIGADGHLYVGAGSLGFHAYRTDGTLLWRTTVDGDIYTAAAIDSAGRLYFATLNGTVYCLDTAGRIVWQRTLGGGFSSSPVLGPDGVLYLGGYDKRLHALNTTDGSTRWNYLLPDEVRATAPIVASDGSVLLGCYDGQLYHFNSTGTLRRTYATGHRIRSSPVLTGSRLYFGSNDGKLYALDLGLEAAASPWPMLQHNPRRLGRAVATTLAQPTITAPTAPALGASVTLQSNATDPGLSHQWQRDGVALAGATSATYTLADFQPRDAGLYTVSVTDGATTRTSDPVLLAPALGSARSAGSADQVLFDVVHPNGNRYDQFLLTGTAATFAARTDRVTRVSFVDLNDDIVQVEFSGSGRVTLVLDAATGPAPAAKYNQPSVAYLKGHARLYFSDAAADSYLSVFSVGTFTAVNQSLFRTDVTYDGVADLALLALASPSGSFAALRAGNTGLFADSGRTGLVAPGVTFAGPVILHDINASGTATPKLLTGPVTSSGEIWITGGNLEQLNAADVEFGDATRVVMRAGTDSHQRLQPAQANRARLVRAGVDVTGTVIQNPAGSNP